MVNESSKKRWEWQQDELGDFDIYGQGRDGIYPGWIMTVCFANKDQGRNAMNERVEKLEDYWT